MALGLLKEIYKALILDPKPPGFFGISYEATTYPSSFIGCVLDS